MVTERGNPMMCHKSKNILTRCFAVFLLFTFLLLSLPAVALAAGSTSISLSSNSVSTGDTVTVTVIGSQSSALSLKYDNTMLELVDGGRATASGNVLTVSASSATFKFRAIHGGNAGLVVSSDTLSGSSCFLPVAESAAQSTENKKPEEKKEEEKKADQKEEKKEDKDSSSKAEKKSSSSKKSSRKKASKKEKTVGNKEEVSQTIRKMSSEDLSFKELITDRRVIAVIILLVAVILVLIIQLVLRGHEQDLDEEDDLQETFSSTPVSNAKKDEVSKAAPSEEMPLEEPPSKKQAALSTPDQGKKGAAHYQADLTMPKAPKSAGQRLDVMDLNDL